MVSEVHLSKPSGTDSEDEEDDTQSTSSSCQEHNLFDRNSCGDVVVRDTEPPAIGNVSVLNCNDVHFGNKTVYQGPVTIKQVLYGNSPAIPEGISADSTKSLDNPSFVGDFPLKNSASKNYQQALAAPSTIEPTHKNGFRRLKDALRRNIIVLVSLLTLLVISLTILTLILTINKHTPIKSTSNINKGDSDEQEKDNPVDPPIDPSSNTTLPGKLKLISRLQWLAQPPTEPRNNLTLPVPYVIIHHTATEACQSQSACKFTIRNIQTYHIESNGWADIGYNFMLGGDGEAYEGRGWYVEGAHSYGYNSRSIGVAFVGTFNTDLPTDGQLKAFKLLVDKALKLRVVKRDYKILAARQLQTTQDPGAAFYELIKTWDHWANSP